MRRYKIIEMLADFVYLTKHTREDFDDYIVWMDTIKKGRFEDTNKMFEESDKFDFKVTHKDAIQCGRI